MQAKPTKYVGIRTQAISAPNKAPRVMSDDDGPLAAQAKRRRSYQ
jgi:hypothetical protein